MAESGFDPCECVWSHELAMRRLVSLLRQSQGHCTDTECFEQAPPGPDTGVGADPFFFTMVWAMLAVALFLLRPSSLRTGKPANQDIDGPPRPPPTSN